MLVESWGSLACLFDMRQSGMEDEVYFPDTRSIGEPVVEF